MKLRLATSYADRIMAAKSEAELGEVTAALKKDIATIPEFREWLLDIWYSKLHYDLKAHTDLRKVLTKEGIAWLKKNGWKD